MRKAIFFMARNLNQYLCDVGGDVIQDDDSMGGNPITGVISHSKTDLFCMFLSKTARNSGVLVLYIALYQP